MILCKEIVQILIHPNVYQVPVVEPRALDRLVGNVKAQGLHEMQDAAGRGAGARDISGVGRDLGFNQYNMQHVKNSLPAVSRQASIFYDRTSQISTVFQKKIKIFVKKIFPLRRSIFGDSYTPTAASRSRGCRQTPERR